MTGQEVRTIYQKWKGLIDRYRGGMPPGFAAAIMLHESGGRVNASGDATLGEAGVYQTTASFPSSVGVDPRLRGTAEGGVFLGLLEYQILAVDLALRYPTLLRLGSEDDWKLARLSFAVGPGGTRKLIESSNPTAGRVFAAVRAFVDTTGGIPLGSQSATKVRDRVRAVDDQWTLGMAVAPAFPGRPERIPAPPGVSYTVPAAVAPYLVSPLGKMLRALAFLAAAGAVLYIAIKPLQAE